MFHLAQAFSAASATPGASRPGLHEDFYVRCTRSGVTYVLPSYEKVRGTKIFVPTEGGEPQQVTAVTNLSFAIEHYLPPSGEYYDQYAIGEAINSPAIDPKGRCLCCYRPKHATHGPKCQKKCLICDKHDHPGMPCRQLYLECDWWKEHGRILGTSSAIPIRPSLSEWAYLSIAGIVEGISNPEGPIVVIWDHPIVNEHYRKPPGPELKSGPPSTLMASMRPRELTQPSSAHRVQQQASVVTSSEGQDTPEVSTQYRGDLERAVTPSVLLPSVVLQEFEDHHARVQDELRAELERQRLRILELEAERDAQRRRADVAIEENEALKDRLAAREDHLNRIIAVACEPESTIGNKRARRDGGVRIKDEYE